MATLGGRSSVTRLTALEVLSDDGTLVLMFDRQDDAGSMVIKTRKPWESAWSSDGTRFSVLSQEAKLLGQLLSNGDVSYSRAQIEAINASDFTAQAPISVPGDQVPTSTEGDCTPLDIERAKAQNLKEERENILLQMERDHALDHHVGAMVPGCPACDRRIRPGYGDGSLPASEPTTEPTDDPSDLPF